MKIPTLNGLFKQGITAVRFRWSALAPIQLPALTITPLCLILYAIKSDLLFFWTSLAPLAFLGLWYTYYSLFDRDRLRSEQHIETMYRMETIRTKYHGMIESGEEIELIENPETTGSRKIPEFIQK